MGAKVASPCFNWPQPSVSHSPSSPQTLASSISSPSSKRCSFGSNEGALLCRYVHRLDRSAFVGFSTSKLRRTGSLEFHKLRGRPGMRRVCSASFDSFSDEEFSQQIQELGMKFQLSHNDEDEDSAEIISALDLVQEIGAEQLWNTRGKFVENENPFMPLEPPDWPERDEMILDSVERKANSLEIPLSLRIIKRKKQWQQGVKGAGETAYCSVKKAFSSMVFIIRELHSYTLQMREMLFYEDLQGILDKVQRETHASFVWLFQQVFSHTPTLMVYVMLLLANYSVYSMSNNAAIAAAQPAQPDTVTTTESVSVVDDQTHVKGKFDFSSIKTFSVSSSSANVASVGGSNGPGGNYRPVASGNDDEGSFDKVSSDYQRSIVPDGAWRNPSIAIKEELALWNSMVDEASKMQAASRDEALDHHTMQGFVSPISAKIESDDAEFQETEELYQIGLAEDPNSTLLLTNYAQFLYVVSQDYDRAEEYFKKAVSVEPKDAEALNKYANFLWVVRKDLWAAEQTYIEAMDAEPNNSYYASNYAHFLWNTGGEDTCYPV